MRPVVVTAILMVVLMFMSDSAAGDLDVQCQNAAPCTGMEDEGWFQLGENRCVKAFHSSSLSFADAEKACKESTSSSSVSSGHLVSIHNKEEQDQVVCAMYKVTPGSPRYWIGLHLTFHYEDYMVYDWTDGTLLDFNSFAPGQPDFFQEAEECVEMNYKCWGSWNDNVCTQERPYVCAVTIK